MSMKDERIFFMEDYEGNLTAVPESKAKLFQEKQEEYRKNPPPKKPLDPELLAWITQICENLARKNSNTSEDTQDN